jgi:hypothetical protein
VPHQGLPEARTKQRGAGSTTVTFSARVDDLDRGGP